MAKAGCKKTRTFKVTCTLEKVGYDSKGVVFTFKPCSKFTLHIDDKAYYIMISKDGPLGDRVREFDVEMLKDLRWNAQNGGVKEDLHSLIFALKELNHSIELSFKDTSSCPEGFTR